MTTSKPSSSDAEPPSNALLLDGLRWQRRSAGHRLRSRGGIAVRSQAQANARASSGVRGKVQTRECGAWRWRRTGRRRAPGAPRQRFWLSALSVLIWAPKAKS